MTRRVGAFVAVAVTLAATGCGGHSRHLADGRWYGKIVAVDGDDHLALEPVCRFAAGRWVAVSRAARERSSTPISAETDVQLYFRPGGSAAAGHSVSGGPVSLAAAVRAGPSADFPAGWFVTVKHGAAVSVLEDAGVRSAGTADRRTFACVWARSTQAFVGS